MKKFDPKAFGHSLRSATTKDDASYKILDKHPSKPDTWQSGGCLMLAHAVERHLPGSRKMDVVNHTTGNTEHVVVQHGDHVFDADGAHHANRFANAYRKRELIKHPVSLQPHDPERAKRSGLVSDTKLVDELHTHLQSRTKQKVRFRPIEKKPVTS